MTSSTTATMPDTTVKGTSVLAVPGKSSPGITVTAVFTLAWARMAINTLPRVLLNNHVMSGATARTNTTMSLALDSETER